MNLNMPKMYCQSLQSEMRRQRGRIGETSNKFPDPVKLQLPPGSLQNIQKVVPKIQQTNSVQQTEDGRLRQEVGSPAGFLESDADSLERLPEADRLGTCEDGERKVLVIQ